MSSKHPQDGISSPASSYPQLAYALHLGGQNFSNSPTPTKASKVSGIQIAVQTACKFPPDSNNGGNSE